MLVTWGPLMVGGVYYAGTGSLPWQVVAAATVYALLPTTVLMGKHIDKLPYDARSGTRTLPVLLGEPVAKAATVGLMLLYYVGVVVLVVLGELQTRDQSPQQTRTVRRRSRRSHSQPVSHVCRCSQVPAASCPFTPLPRL